jgi:hypothetical protein
VVRQGAFDPKAAETLGARVHACWINPNMQPPTPAPAAATPAQPTPPAKQ